MRTSLRSLLLFAVLILSAVSIRPASAQTIGGAQELVISGINAGHYKCDIFHTLNILLNIAGTTTDAARRLQALTMARDCACALSREINRNASPPAPFQTLGAGIFDLAGYWHTVPAQTYGQALCALLTALVILYS